MLIDRVTLNARRRRRARTTLMPKESAVVVLHQNNSSKLPPITYRGETPKIEEGQPQRWTRQGCRADNSNNIAATAAAATQKEEHVDEECDIEIEQCP